LDKHLCVESHLLKLTQQLLFYRLVFLLLASFYQKRLFDYFLFCHLIKFLNYRFALPLTFLSLGFFLLAEALAFLEAEANIAPAAFLETPDLLAIFA
jgi:hypothetical protein